MKSYFFRLYSCYSRRQLKNKDFPHISLQAIKGGVVIIMKKNILYASMIMLLVLLSGCNKNKQNTEEITGALTPTVQPMITTPVEDNKAVKPLTISDYYPLLADTEYVYEGQGNEYAAYNRVTDFLDAEKKRIQTRTNNGGMETVSVMEIKDGKLSVIAAVNESYSREDIMTDAVAGTDAEVLLMEPLVQGTEWTLQNGSKRYISATEVEVETPSGNYKAIEVTTDSTDSTDGSDGITKDYYAPQVGLVKSVFSSGDMEVTSSLREIKTNAPFTQAIDIFYPDADEKIYVEPLTLTFRTGEKTRTVLQDAICKEAAKASYLPLASIKTKINSLYLGEDGIVHVDFSPELVSDMNAGSGYEVLILQSITNTLGNYYGVEEVLITMEGKPYESGHILMKEGETFKVNMDNVVR